MNKSSFDSSTGQPPHDPLAYIKKQGFGYGYGYYFRPLQDYHDGKLSRTEVELLEYLLGMSEYYLREGHPTFYHSYTRIHEDTRIAVETIKRIVKKFKRVGLLNSDLTTQYGRRVTTFEVNYLGIIRKRTIVFGKPLFKTKEQIQRIRQRLVALTRMYRKRHHLLKLEKKRY